MRSTGRSRRIRITDLARCRQWVASAPMADDLFAAAARDLDCFLGGVFGEGIAILDDFRDVGELGDADEGNVIGDEQLGDLAGLFLVAAGEDNDQFVGRHRRNFSVT